MASSTNPTELITSEPVIVNAVDAETPETAVNEDASVPETTETRLLKLEQLIAAQALSSNVADADRGRSPSPTPVPRIRERSWSPVLRRRRFRSISPGKDLAIIENTTDLISAISASPAPDRLVEVHSGTGRLNTHMLYLTSLPTHQAELEKFSWIFQHGVEGSWVQKPVTFAGRVHWSYDAPGAGNGNGRRRGVVDNDYDDFRGDRGTIPVAKLGVLFNERFPEATAGDLGVGLVKFVTVIQDKKNVGWFKLIVSHSRAAALVDIFHELVNGLGVAFVGAVLEHVAIPSARPQEATLWKANSVKHAQEVGETVLAVIC